MIERVTLNPAEGRCTASLRAAALFAQHEKLLGTAAYHQAACFLQVVAQRSMDCMQGEVAAHYAWPMLDVIFPQGNIVFLLLMQVTDNCKSLKSGGLNCATDTIYRPEKDFTATTAAGFQDTCCRVSTGLSSIKVDSLTLMG